MKRFSRIGVLVLASAIQIMVTACSNVPADSAAVVNGVPVPAHYYDSMVTASKRRAEQVGIPVVWDSAAGVKRLTVIQTETIKRLVQNAVVDQLAKEKGVAVSDSDLDLAIGKIEVAFGGSNAVNQRLDQSGMSRADFRDLYRYFLLDQKLRQTDPNGYQTTLDQKLKGAKVQVFVAPCTTDHDFATCLESAAK